jgi:hypothetical protein
VFLRLPNNHFWLKSLYQNEEWARCFLAGSWQGATKEHSQSSVTEEQRRQVPARKQPSGLPIFGNAPVPHFDTGS